MVLKRSQSRLPMPMTQRRSANVAPLSKRIASTDWLSVTFDARADPFSAQIAE